MRRHLAPMSFAESSPFTTPTSPPETGASIADEPKPAARVDCLSRAEATRRPKESGGRLRIEEGMPVSEYVKKGYSMVISNGETQNI